jgi:uracil-DNA glycosylase family 4
MDATMDAAAALRLQVEWGADEALDELPWDRLRPVAPARPLPVPAPSAPSPSIPASAAPAQARQLAVGAATLDTLRTALEGFDGSPLRATASALVFGDGACAAGVALVGEAPDAESDRSGRAFAGPGGRLLDAMLGSIGLQRDDVRLLTLVPWRPPGGRAPSEAEIAACLPFAQRHIALLRPRALVLMGNLACRWVGGIEGGSRRARGRWHAVAVPGLDAPVPALALSPPEQVLTQPAMKEAAWGELLRLRRFLDESLIAER